jgi:hypothetical protein
VLRQSGDGFLDGVNVHIFHVDGFGRLGKLTPRRSSSRASSSRCSYSRALVRLGPVRAMPYSVRQSPDGSGDFGIAIPSYELPACKRMAAR